MSKIPTAEEELNAMFRETGFDITNKIQRSMVISSMKLFAKLHVEAALKEVSENFKMKIKDDVHELDMNDDWMEVDKKSILNAYPLENIK